MLLLLPFVTPTITAHVLLPILSFLQYYSSLCDTIQTKSPFNEATIFFKWNFEIGT